MSRHCFIPPCILLRRHPLIFIFSLLFFVSWQTGVLALSDLPPNFENSQVISGLQDPDGFVFSPDGRMFIGERINGRLLVAHYQPNSDTWAINPQPFYTFDIPKDGNGNPLRIRSAGLRDIAFDPDFANNGYIYAFYMKNGEQQNRVVRIKADPNNPDLVDSTFAEQLLIRLPFNNLVASGSHNGGALEFGSDNKLYITTGDGWEGEFAGDPVQSLTTFTGKVLRINPDGSIPSDNPFFSQTVGDYRAIYALGLRNPFSMSRHPETGALYINEARGDNKADVYLVEAGANYYHEGTHGGGEPRLPWANASHGVGGNLITGGAWYPQNGPFPADYHGVYFTPMWGGNGETVGQINYIRSNSDTSVAVFETNIGQPTDNGLFIKPILTRIGPDGHLYYMLTTYETSSGTIQRVRYTAQETAVSPTISPSGGSFIDAVVVSLTTPSLNSQIRYTLDSSEPTETSQLYTAPFTLFSDTVVKARTYASAMNPSSVASASFTIGQTPANEPPIANAGADKTAVVGQLVTLDGSGSVDPDGSDDLLSENWTQTAGPPVTLVDSGEEIAFFTPIEVGTYRFELWVTDGTDASTDEVVITAVLPSSCLTNGIQARYDFNEGTGATVYDHSNISPPHNLSIHGNTTWIANGLRLNGLALLHSATAASKITQASKATNALTVEAWLEPANTTQYGPARIVTLSSDIDNRNFMLGQGLWEGQQNDIFDFRIRTTWTSPNGQPSLTTPNGQATTSLTHVVYTHEASGWRHLYINGTAVSSSLINGDFSNWDDSYYLGLGNELTWERPWLGTFYRVGIYNCALSSSDIEVNYRRGALAPPVAPSFSWRVFLPILNH